MSDTSLLTLSRRAALGGMFAVSFAGAARAQSSTAAIAACDPASIGVQDTIYEYDIAGKPVEWDFPSGDAAINGLNLKGLGLQKTGSKKDTSDPGFDDAANLGSRFLNKSSKYDWHPASLWSVQFAGKAVDAIRRDRNVIGATSISDEEFAYQRLCGVNPCMLRRIISDPTFKGLMEPGAAYYSVDYSALETLEDNDHVSGSEDHGAGDRQRFGYQPKALFKADGGEMKPVAIQIKRGANSALVKAGEQDWELAKFIVQNADVNYHQLVTHLGRTHLYLEAFAVAAGMTLPRSSHPVSLLLRPHFEGTININDFANTDLINVSPESQHGGVFDLNFSGTMETNIKLIAEEVFGLYDEAAMRRDPALAKRAANLFNESMFPRDIAARGVGHFREEAIRESNDPASAEIGFGLLHATPGAAPGAALDFDYRYLEDSCKLWNAITDWVGRYVNVYYKSDKAVEGDCELQAWARTVTTGGSIRGFGEYQAGKTLLGQIHSRAYLVQALTSIIFTASAQHSAVNFSQADYGPTLPAGIYRDYFNAGDAELTDYLPNKAHFKEVMNTLSILAASQYTTLGKYHENTSSAKRLRSVNSYFKQKEVRACLKQFQSALERIEKDIKARGADAMGRKYEYLLPSRIPQSTNV